eukprot:CAMPEP_0119320662 /NCGR_PEP_ID=MMETSP1333-20130426/53047_1 /TAXON_ID=418940 /ORGANISM="Scyphosphaera apsteinii, Strain RCC1455" /LENGTH=234 /DNA_ID=CAMNT_0007327425 /DNA_START=56 /DNA_END=760 /DNA_ORIENTATION=-
MAPERAHRRVMISSASPTCRGTVPVTCAHIIEATEACAQEQREEYFRLMPSRELPKVSLDLRAFASKANDNYEAGIFSRQDGAIPQWKNVGTVATTSPDQITQAVAKQRALIERWAYEVCNDFETNELLMVLEGGPPIQIAWAIKPEKPSFFDSLMGKQDEAVVLNEVDRTAGFDPVLPCGFLGKPAREYRGGGVSARYERIVIGKPPEVPVRDISQAKYNAKYAKKLPGVGGR